MRLSVSKDLSSKKVAAKEAIDVSAGEVRKFFITAVPGQEMVYQQKRIEAEAVTANPEINPAEVPHIALEAALNQISLLDQAAIILTMANQWTGVSAVIEDRRLGAKAAVDQATNPAEIEAARIIDWTDILNGQA